MLIWLIFAILTAFCLIIVLSPLARVSGSRLERGEFDVEIYRDQLRQLEREIEAGVLNEAEAEAARLEISRRLLAAAPQEGGSGDPAMARSSSLPRLAAAAVAVGAPALALAIYWNVGSPNLPGQPFVERQQAAIANQDMASLILRVEEHLRANPGDARGWKIIAPAYLQLRRFNDAASAFARVLDLQGRDAAVLTDYAEALVLSRQGLVTEQARAAFLEAALQDRKQFKAVFYLGLAERQDGKPQAAIKLWQRILDEASKEAPWRAAVETQIAAARNSLSTAPELTDEQIATTETLSQDERNQMVDAMVSKLAARLEENGKDLEGWLRLARSYAVLGRADAAREALDKAETNFAGDTASLDRIKQARGSFGLVANDKAARAPALSNDQVDAAQSMTAEERREMIEGMVGRLAARLEDSGKDLEGWLRLARAYTVLGRADAAREALDKAEANFAGDTPSLERIKQARASFGLAAVEKTTNAPVVSDDQIDDAQSMTAEERREMIEGMVARLAARLADDGKDLEGWLRLARSYMVLGRRDDARKALDTAAVTFAGDTTALGRIAQARDSFGLNSE